MPNGKPGDHPLTDITVHKIRTYSRRADSLVRKLADVVSPAILWSFLYLLYREDDVIRVAGSQSRISIREFENILADLLDSTKPITKAFKSAEQKIKKK